MIEPLDRWMVNQRALSDENFPEDPHWVVASWTPFHWDVMVCHGRPDWPIPVARWRCRTREEAEELFFTVTPTGAHLCAEALERDRMRALEQQVKHFG